MCETVCVCVRKTPLTSIHIKRGINNFCNNNYFLELNPGTFKGSKEGGKGRGEVGKLEKTIIIVINMWHTFNSY